MGIVGSAACGAAVGSVLGGTLGMATDYALFNEELSGKLIAYSATIGAIGGSGGAAIVAEDKGGSINCVYSTKDITE